MVSIRSWNWKRLAGTLRCHPRWPEMVASHGLATCHHHGQSRRLTPCKAPFIFFGSLWIQNSSACLRMKVWRWWLYQMTVTHVRIERYCFSERKREGKREKLDWSGRGTKAKNRRAWLAGGRRQSWLLERRAIHGKKKKSREGKKLLEVWAFAHVESPHTGLYSFFFFSISG